MESTSRDEIVLALRPELNLAAASGSVEAFQNDVLRPILKFQNEFLMIAAGQYVKKYHKTFNALKKSIRRPSSFKHQSTILNSNRLLCGR